MSTRTFTEITLPLEYGKLAAKDWGPPNGRPVLALHGWQDNAGTFDTLIPWLDPTLRIVAVDFPGHGFSSHKPKGSLYHYMEYLLDIKAVVKHLEWTKFSLLGHSMGAGLSMMYASVFPDNVENVISVDLIKPVTCPPAELAKRTAASINQSLLQIGNKNDAPVYTYDEALERLLKGTLGSLTKASANAILRRGVKPSENGKGVVYTRDIRLQIESLQKIDDHTCRQYLSGIKCNLLLIKAKNGFNRETPSVVQNYRDMFSRNCSKFLYVEVDGTHHVHLNNPAVVGPLINSFMSSSFTE